MDTAGQHSAELQNRYILLTSQNHQQYFRFPGLAPTPESAESGQFWLQKRIQWLFHQRRAASSGRRTPIVPHRPDPLAV